MPMRLRSQQEAAALLDRHDGGAMILGVNGIRLAVARSGVARCIENVLRCLDDLPHPFSEIRVYSPLPLPDDVVLPRGATNVVLRSTLPNALWEQVTLPRAHRGAGVLFCPSYVVPLLARCPTVLVHHGSYEGYPRAFSWWVRNKARVAYGLSAWRATIVSTVSEYSRRDMERYYGLPRARIRVVPEGVDTHQFHPIADTAQLVAWRRSFLGDDLPYLTYVGKPTERRNLSALIRAFGRLKAGGLPHKLAIVGADLPGTSPFRRVIDQLGLEREVLIRGHASHDEMVLVYNAADLLIYPSSYEGFGMPVLEAMACGTPVIALDNTAFPEFAGGVVELLPDARVETLAQGIAALLSDMPRRTRMRTEGPRRAASYDWRLVTQRYLDLIIPLAKAWSAR
jgi:glycosyltransferase involved in cell wall biosynthesis